MIALGWILALLLFVSLPYWLPRAIVALRVHIFTHIDGAEGIAIPGALVDVGSFMRVYADPAADGRSRGAALSDLFWYWLSPGAEMHQEHLEAGPRYDRVAQATRRILALPKKAAEEFAARVATRVLDEQEALLKGKARFVRLRELTMPIWADFYYELVFGQVCPKAARALIIGNANDVVTALKCCSLRHMQRRAALTNFLIDKLRAGELPHELPEGLSIEEQAFYLQGVFFNTAVVQMSEASTHLLLVIAQHRAVQARLAADPDDHEYLEHVINETLRLYPLFGISHRISSAEIALENGATIAKGSVLCFDHAQFQRAGFTQPERFEPDRWQQIAPRDANFIPFGVSANRPCPAQAIALITLRIAARELLRRFSLASSAAHTRSIPNRGPCMLVPRAVVLGPWREQSLLALMRLRDRWEDLGRSFVQLILGSYMLWDARRLRLCTRYFDGQKPSKGPGTSAGGCPLTGPSRGF